MAAETLDDLCSLIVDCPHNTAPLSTEPFGYAVGTTAINAAGQIDLSKARPVDEATYATWTARAVPRPGDLIFCREAPVGPVAVVPPGTPVCLGQRTMLLRPDFERLDHRWLAYKLRSPATLAAMLSLADGSTVAHVNVAEVRRFPIKAPPLSEQQRVASVLAAFDNKLESNQRTARALAEVVIAATAHASSRADEVIAVSAFGVQLKEPGGLDRPYVGLDVMPLGNTILNDWTTENAPTGASWSFEPGDLLYGKLRPYFRKVVVAPIAGRCTREIVVLRPTEPLYYGLLVGTVASQQFIDFCTAVSSGTKMPRAEWGEASRFEVGLPARDVLGILTQETRAAYEAVAGLVRESRALASIRDALLPKLVSGQIRVPVSNDPDEEVGGAVDRLEAEEAA